MSGKITKVLPMQSGISKDGNEWAKQEYVLCHDEGQYPRYVTFTVFGADKIKAIAIQEGETLTVNLNIDSRESPGDPTRWFNSIYCWRVERPQQMQGYQPPHQPAQPTAQTTPQPHQQPQPTPRAYKLTGDPDLPF